MRTNTPIVAIIICATLLLSSFSGRTWAQSVGINSTGAHPDASAILDVSSSDKGMLIPRLTTTERDAISNPALSLLIFNTSSNCLEMYNISSSVWESVYCFKNCATPSSSPVATASTNAAGSSFSANWTSVTNATSYYIDVATDAAFTTFLSGYNNRNVGNVLTYSVSGTNCGTTYYYRLKAGNACGTGSYSNTISVTMTGSPAVAPVASAATNIGWTNFTANWSAATGASAYYLDVATDASFTNLVSGYNDINVGNLTTYNISPTTTGLITSGIQGLWHADNNWTDATSNGNNGTATNGATYSTGKLGSAAGSFDGVNDFVTMGDPANGSLDFGTGDFTWAFWVNVSKTTPLNNEWPILAKSGAAGAHGNGFEVEVSSWGAGISIISFFITPTTYYAAPSTGYINPNQWYHVAFTRSGTSVMVYLDGVLKATTTNANMATPIDNSKNFQVSENTWGNGYFGGKVDEVGVWNRALSESEISTLYNGGVGTQIKNVYYYRVRADNGCGVSSNSNSIQTQ